MWLEFLKALKILQSNIVLQFIIIYLKSRNEKISKKPKIRIKKKLLTLNLNNKKFKSLVHN